MKYCSMSTVKTLLMYEVCITKRPREILQRLTDFWIKKNDILRLFECLELSESTACYQNSKCDHILALCILLKRLSNPSRCKDTVPLFERNPTGLRLIITLYFLYQRHHRRLESWDLFFVIFTELCRCSSWKKLIFIELFWLCSWNNCSYLQTKGWRIAAMLGQWCKISEWFCQMAWLSTLKGNEKAEDMIVYYALWTGSTKITSVVGII